MAKRPRKKMSGERTTLPTTSRTGESVPQSYLVRAWIPLTLAVITFLVYWPSLSSDFVYDGRTEILQEGFVTSLSNLPAVLTFKVLGMSILLAQRPGQILYMMSIAAVGGKDPFYYHLGSNLLHAANVALLFVLLRRLLATEMADFAGACSFRPQFAAAVAALIFALHPIAVESVSEISYSSSLLVALFSMLALLAATFFYLRHFRAALIAGGAGTFCAFAGVASKESGVTVAAILIVYWFLYRRHEAVKPWLLFLTAASAVTVLFLAARFHYDLTGAQDKSYLGGSLSQVFVLQPGLWVFMLGKVLWPIHLSADYTPLNLGAPSPAISVAILIMVLALQACLAWRSRMGALGVAIYWLGLATVSNFVPLYCPVADRFYYLPLAGVAMQLLALFLMTLKSRWGFWLALAPFLVALVPLTVLTLTRQQVFSGELALWSDTVRVSPLSPLGHSNLGSNYFLKGRVDEALAEYRKALELAPTSAKAEYNLGGALYKIGQVDESIPHFLKALALDPKHVKARDDLGIAYMKKGQLDAAIDQFQQGIAVAPGYAEIHNSLGVALARKGQMEDAMVQFEEAVQLNPDFKDAANNLAKAQAIEQRKMAPK